MLPVLVAADPWVVALKAMLQVAFYTVVTWKSPGSCLMMWLSGMDLGLSLGLLVVRFFGPRRHPMLYAKWRWVIILTNRMMSCLATGSVAHCLVEPAHSFYSFLKNLLVASGILSGVGVFFDQEMIHLSCLCSTIHAAVLWRHAEELCRQGLVATEYGAVATRVVSFSLDTVATVVINLVDPEQRSSQVELRVVPDLTQELPLCMCTVRTLTIVLVAVLPNAMLYSYETGTMDRALQRWVAQPGAGRDLGAVQQEGPRWEGVLPPYVHTLLIGTLWTLLMSTVIWAVLCKYYQVRRV